MSTTGPTAKPAAEPKTKKRQPWWLLYGALLIAGFLMLFEAVGYAPMQRLTAKLAVALIYSALALIVTNGRRIGIWSSVIVWLAVVGTLLIR
ncbi:MAG: hypothetical protein D6800_11980 [Candidatus Zixiibacteriota bacterium]|nr:MAG: hypothetical protein D6800_11980 [candidate division Zixibacteria bacterium]